MIHGVETTVKEKNKDAVDILMPDTSCSIETVMGGSALRGGYIKCVPSQHVTLLLSKRYTILLLFAWRIHVAAWKSQDATDGMETLRLPESTAILFPSFSGVSSEDICVSHRSKQWRNDCKGMEAR